MHQLSSLVHLELRCGGGAGWQAPLTRVEVRPSPFSAEVALFFPPSWAVFTLHAFSSDEKTVEEVRC